MQGVRLLLGIGLALVFVAAAGAEETSCSQEAVCVTLERHVELPAGRTLRLEQIADLAGPRRAEAAGVELGEVPAPRRQRAVSRLTVQRALELAGFTRSTFSIEGPTQARVSGEGVPLERADVQSAVEAALARIAPEAEVSIEQIQLPRGVEMPPGDHELRVADSFVSPRQGPNRVPLEIVTSSGGVRRVGIYVRMAIEGPLVVAAREVRRGQRVAPEDVKVEQRPYPSGRELFHAEEDVIGLVARSTLRAGDPVRGTSLGPHDAVVSGQKVEAIYHQGGVQLVLQTTARGSGGVGSIVPVTGQDGTSILEARVVRNGRVLILGSETSR